MSQPKPIDVNKLKNILSGAKAVMEKVENGDYSEGNVQLDNTVSGEQLIESNQLDNVPIQQPVAQHNNSGGYRNIENSKLPPNVLKAMVENPIPQLTNPNHTFNLEDVSDIARNNMRKTNHTNKKRKNVNENRMVHNNDTFTVSETVLRAIIKEVVKEELFGFMNETYAKSLTEQAIKKTINTLIKEGKIKTKKTVNS